MPSTDLSVGPPAFVSFDYNGWPTEKKRELQIAVRDLVGVSKVNSAGGNSAIHVHFNPDGIRRETLVYEVNRLADEILPRPQSGGYGAGAYGTGGYGISGVADDPLESEKLGSGFGAGVPDAVGSQPLVTEAVSAGTLTIDSEPVTIDGETIEFGDPSPAGTATFAPAHAGSNRAVGPRSARRNTVSRS